MKKFLAVALMSAAVILFAGQSAQAKTERGFRISVGSVPGVDELEFDDGFGSSATVELDDESGINVNPAFVIRTGIDKPVGFVGVFGLFVKSHKGKDVVGDEVELTVIGISAAPGLSVNLSKRVHLEFRGELDLGSADQSITGFSDGSGPYYSLGLNVGAYFKVNRVMVLGADIGFTKFSSIGEVSIGGQILDSEFSGSGPVGNVSLGFMF
jgi:hypothetical protein